MYINGMGLLYINFPSRPPFDKLRERAYSICPRRTTGWCPSVGSGNKPVEAPAGALRLAQGTSLSNPVAEPVEAPVAELAEAPVAELAEA